MARICLVVPKKGLVVGGEDTDFVGLLIGGFDRFVDEIMYVVDDPLHDSDYKRYWLEQIIRRVVGSVIELQCVDIPGGEQEVGGSG